MNVLVIGGTGLISTAITRDLADADHDVTVYNRGETGGSIPKSASRIVGDRTDHDRFTEQVADLDVDCVIDMVCFGPETAETAVDAFAGDVDQYVFCSTIDVYHRPPAAQPVTEEAAREPGVSDYGREKAAAEDVFLAADERGDFAATVIRPWSTIGEGGAVLHTFGSGSYYLDRLRDGRPVVVHGDGTSLWGTCHRDDVARAFVASVGNQAAYGEAYHVTSEETITWNQYHRRVADAIGAPDPELVHVPTDVLREVFPERTRMLRDHFQYSTVFDNANARRDLGFEQRVGFEETIRRTVERQEEAGIDDWETEPRDGALIEAWRESTGDLAERVADRLDEA